MAKGKVKFFNSQKGFGFIVPDEGGKDLFVHTTNIINGAAIHEGQSVEFEAAQGRKGPEATKVRPLKNIKGFPIQASKYI